MVELRVKRLGHKYSNQPLKKSVFFVFLLKQYEEDGLKIVKTGGIIEAFGF